MLMVRAFERDPSSEALQLKTLYWDNGKEHGN